MSTRRSDPITFPGRAGRSLRGFVVLPRWVRQRLFKLSTVSAIAFATGSGRPSRSTTWAMCNLSCSQGTNHDSTLSRSPSGGQGVCPQELRTPGLALPWSTTDIGLGADIGPDGRFAGQISWAARGGRWPRMAQAAKRKTLETRGGEYHGDGPGAGTKRGVETVRDGVSRGLGWTAALWTHSYTTGAPRPRWIAHSDAPTWSGAGQKQSTERRPPAE